MMVLLGLLALGCEKKPLELVDPCVHAAGSLVPGDDGRTRRTTQRRHRVRAQMALSEFVEAFNARSGASHQVKRKDETRGAYEWIKVERIEGDTFYGHDREKRAKSVRYADVYDWMYSLNGGLMGAYSLPDLMQQKTGEACKQHLWALGQSRGLWR
jgi:hypothetical protein